MLIALVGQRLEGGGGDAGMAAHADADHRHLGQAGLRSGSRRSRSSALSSSSTRSALSTSPEGTVKVMSVVVPSSEMFWTIMSTLMLASASGPKIAGGDARPVGDAAQRDLGLVLGIGDAGDDLLFHDFFLVANQRSGRVQEVAHARRIGILEGRAHEGADLVHHGKLDRAHLQHLGAERRHFQHFLEGDLRQAARLGLDARIGRVDAVDVGIDVAAVGLDRGGDRHRAEVSEPPRPSVAMRLSGPMPWKPAITATWPSPMRRIMSAPSISRMRAAPCALSVRIGICQPCQERALMPIDCSAIASRPDVTCSPEATTASYSRAS